LPDLYEDNGAECLVEVRLAMGSGEFDGTFLLRGSEALARMVEMRRRCAAKRLRPGKPKLPFHSAERSLFNAGPFDTDTDLGFRVVLVAGPQ